MRFFVIWAYFASPWFSATCHKAIRNIRGFRERRRGGVLENVPCLLPCRIPKDRPRRWRRDCAKPIMLSRPRPMAGGNYQGEKGGGETGGVSR